MIFAEMPLDEAEGAILGYAMMAGALTLRKGTVLDVLNLALLREAGISSVLAARLEKGDIGEDEAALAIGRMLISGEVEIGSPTTGRVNLHARKNGVFLVDADRIDAVNAHDARISIATLRNHVRVEAGQMVATVKIIPFAVPGTLLRDIGLDARPALRVHPFNGARIWLIQSRLPSIRETVLEKTRELMGKRTTRNGGTLVCEKRVAHDQVALAAAIAEVSRACDIIVIFSASRLPTKRISYRSRSACQAVKSCASACRSIRAICWSWAGMTANILSPPPDRPAAPAKTASTGCWIA